MDGFAAVMFEAVRKGLAEGLDDVFGVLGSGPQLGGDMHAQGVVAFVAGRA